MIAYKGREVKRGRKTQMARNIERLYKESKCRDCSVIVTRMDFAKILGKFTKVKIQYENVTSPKTKKVIAEVVSPANDNSRLKKSNENGMVLFRRNAYNKHPINNSQIGSKKPRNSETSSPRPGSNVLKENNGMNKSAVLKDKNSNYNTKHIHSDTKQYTIIFVDPKTNNNKDSNNQILLAALVPKIDKSLLPSEDWLIDYLPKPERRDDKVYDRIEAELEGLMFSEKPEEKTVKQKPEEKVDEFPSIMDILNDNYSVTESKQNDQNVILEFKSNLESSDVEAMLLGKSSSIVKISESTPMEVDSNVMSKLIEDVETISTVASVEKDGDKSEKIVQLSITENPQSPSILDENLQKGAEEYIPAVPVPAQTEALHEDINRIPQEEGNKNSNNDTKTIPMEIKINIGSLDTMSELSSDSKANDTKPPNPDSVTHVVFKKLIDGQCTKIVTCPMNLKYSIEIEGKSVEFLGAPKYISSVEDLKVLLQIVNESGLDSLYVLH